MDVTTPIRPADLFSAKGLVVVITGGGSGTSLEASELPHQAPRPHVPTCACWKHTVNSKLIIAGLGLAIASALHQNGAERVYLLGRRADVLDNAANNLQSNTPRSSQSSGGSVHGIPCDVTDLTSVRAAAETIKKDIGYVDVLINNAGVIGPKNGADIYKAESIQQLADTMVAGYDDCPSSASALPSSLCSKQQTHAADRAPGKVTGTGNARARDTSAAEANGIDTDDDRMAHIITVASVASYMRWVSAGLAYNASKAAAAHLGKMMATFLSEWGVRSNIVCPGPYPSEMTAGIHPVYGTNQIPQGRMGGIGDISGLMLFLVGKGGAYVNGTTQLTDGGRVGVFPAVY
ncbi:unnamed protein product [Alternaria alternata]